VAVKILASALVAHWNHHLLLLPASAVVVARAQGLGRPVRDHLGGLHPGLFAPPQTPWYARTDAATATADVALAAAWRLWLRAAGIRAASLRWTGRIRHAITHHDVQLEVFQVELDAGGKASLDASVVPGRAWQTLQEGAENRAKVPLTTPARQCLILTMDSQQTR
jgi:hypothetical protein